jgi:hypothetical protein
MSGLMKNSENEIATDDGCKEWRKRISNSKSIPSCEVMFKYLEDKGDKFELFDYIMSLQA